MVAKLEDSLSNHQKSPHGVGAPLPMNTGIFDFANRETPGLTGVNKELLAPSKTVFRGAVING